MKIVLTICRVLLGLVFFVFGLNGFLRFIPAPPISGHMLTFFTVLMDSKYYIVIFGAQVIAGALLLLNQYVPLALVVLAAVLVNILTFHATMQPQGLPSAMVAAILWFVLAWSLRAHFAPLLTRRV